MIGNISGCRMCGGALTPFLDMGLHPPSDQFLRESQLHEPCTFYPLNVCLCERCGLVQLRHVVSPEILYRHDYPYEASTTATGRAHFAAFAAKVCKDLKIPRESLVVDVGSNVGVLLDGFRSQDMRVLGVEPAANIARLSERRGIETVCEFFSRPVAEDIRRAHGPAAVVTGTNVFAHIDDLEGCMQAVDALLEKDGAFIFEAPYLLELVRKLEYDTIYHEHLSYLSVKPVALFAKRFGFEVFDVQEQAIHGGSFRVFMARRGRRKVLPSVRRYLEREKAADLHGLRTLRAFAARVERHRQELLWLLRKLKHEGRSIAGVSAPAKGMSLLNYCHIGLETLDFVTEKSALKIGRYTPGGNIPVLPDAELVRRRPDYALLLAWNFADEIMKNLDAYKKKGGRFIVPIPRPRIVDR